VPRSPYDETVRPDLPPDFSIEGLDLREEFENFLRQHGHYIVYIRRDTNIRCRCWDFTANAPSSDKSCPRCYGTGYKVSLERHLMRKAITGSPLGLAATLQSREPGQFLTPSFIGYFKPLLRPQAGDKVVEVTWDRNTGALVRITAMYEVSTIDDKRQDGGELVFYTLWGDRESINIPAKEAQLKIDTVLVVD